MTIKVLRVTCLIGVMKLVRMLEMQLSRVLDFDTLSAFRRGLTNNETSDLPFHTALENRIESFQGTRTMAENGN
jgi:hypothetical protein